jgi:HEAT repeat protein
MFRVGFVFVLGIVIVLQALPAAAAEPDGDEQALQAIGLATDGTALLSFFNLRSDPTPDPKHLDALIRRLADRSAAVRDATMAELVARGAPTVPALRRAANDLDDAGRADLARVCLKRIEGPAAGELSAAAARLLAVRKPAGAAAALLRFLPFAEDDASAEAVIAALGDTALVNGAPESALLNSLQSSSSAQRAAAAEVLCRTDQAAAQAAVRSLLHDPKPLVRARAALALGQCNDAEAVPVLIELLGELPAGRWAPIEQFLHGLAGDWAPNTKGSGDDAVARKILHDAWAAWWNNTDAPTLVAEFRKQTLSADDHVRIARLIVQLSDGSFRVRDRAAAELVATGPKAAGLLHQASRSAEPERARRADLCLKRIGQAKRPLPPEAARLLAMRRPQHAAQVLLDYLPFAEDEAMAAEVQTALGLVAMVDGKPNADLRSALADREPVRRAAAAEALCKSGGPALHDAVRPLLRDPDPRVRLRTAVALASSGDRSGVAALIDLLPDLPAETVEPGLEFLAGLAGEKAPDVTLGSDDAGRAKWRAAWAAWWKDNAATVPLTRTGAPGLLGLTLISELRLNNQQGRVIEVGRDGKIRWQIDNLQYPVDVWALPGERVLIAEYSAARVTERDRKGNVLWEFRCQRGQPVNTQRLQNGNTFIATNAELFEVDRAGKVVWTIPQPNGVIAAYRAPSGEIVCLTNHGQCLWLDTKGKELRNVPSQRDASWTSGIDVTPAGQVLVSRPNQSKVTLIDRAGKTVWEVDVPQVTTATRLPNGHVLTASYNGRRVTELDRGGKVVWEYKDDFMPYRVRRR